MRMLFHSWIPPPIMITKDKLNTYPPLLVCNPRDSGVMGVTRIVKNLSRCKKELLFTNCALKGVHLALTSPF